MKISTRLSLISAFILSCILIVFGIAIYLLESSHQKNDFQNRLKERVEITERFFLEKDSFNEAEYEKIKTQFLHTLPEETEEVIPLKDNVQPTFQHEYSPVLKGNLLGNTSHSFKENKIQGESKIFQINNEQYLIIVTAIDEVGIQNLSFLMSRIFLLILIVVPLIFILSFIITKRYLSPISKEIKHANEISASNLSERLSVINPNDEIGKLAIAFNKLLDRLEVAFTAQKSFISNASHEIKNPLTAIMGEAEVALSKTRTPEEYEEVLNKIVSETDTLNSTVNNLLQLSKVSVNEEHVRFEKFDLGNFLSQVKDSYSYQNPNNQINTKLNTNKDHIKGNKNLLKTAIINLFDNACKYSSNQPVEVELTNNAESVILKIKDHGIGIPQSDIKKITQPFYRANNVFDYKGSGVGLSLTTKIIDIHKGDLFIQSKEGVGTEITITFPLS